MLVAYHLAGAALPDHTSKFSRHDFTLPQLFACLCAKELMKRSYRQAEALLRDAPEWCRAIGMTKPPDHNTLCRAARVLLGRARTGRLLDAMARWAALARVLRLSTRPLAGDSSVYEPRHVSRYFEWRRGRGGGNAGRRKKLRDAPKLAVGVASACHLIVSAWTGTGSGGDHPHFERLLFDAWRRVPHRTFTCVFDAGYDSERNHAIARRDMGLRSIIPPLIGRPGRRHGRWRRHMQRLLRTRASRRACGYTKRWQAETVNSMIKRNLGSALRGRTRQSRERDMLLKVLTHNVMIIRRQQRVETEQECPL